MAAPCIVDDELWAVVEPLLPVKPTETSGPAQMDSHLGAGILFVLITGIGWKTCPRSWGSVWDDLLAQVTGLAGRRAFEQIHQAVLARAHAARLIDFDRVMGRRLARAGKKRGAAKVQSGPPPKTGSKHHILTYANGFPRAVGVQRQRPPDAARLGPALHGRVDQPAAGSPI
ncbi:transposase [Nocardia ignorata]|uniref:transposase n=1 Tax=Nocardia ignorata TaxID=145285 RepID=UPI00362E396A